MRFIHTSDWHLGRALHGVRLIEDQAHILDQFVRIVADVSPDLVVIAGDVFDRAQPSRESLGLLNDTLNRIVAAAGVPVLAIAGNHDSAELIEFGAQIAEKGDLYLCGVLSEAPSFFDFADDFGPVRFYALPYADPAVVRERWGLAPEDVPDHDAAFRVITNRIRADHPEGHRSIMVAHAFVTGGRESESERPLAVGGAGNVSAEYFDGFDYTCLGHLHRPQSVGREIIRYSGSLLKYSASEIGHEKSLTLVEMDAAGAVTTEELALVPRRDFRELSGAFDDLCADGPQGAAEDYLVVNLTDRGPIPDAMTRLREIYPNVLHINRVRGPAGDGRDITIGDHQDVGPEDMFESFYRYITEEDLDGAQKATIAKVVHAARLDDSEAG